MVRSHAAGDDPQFYAVALQVAARAARQGHHRIAAELKDLVEQAREKSPATVTAIAQPRGDLADLVTASFPEVGLDDLVIRDEIRSSLEQVVLEQRQRHALVEKGFAPSHRLLLEGPPGTGKTMTAGVLAHELSLPLLTIRLDSVFSRFMGETSGKLRVLFDAVEHQRAVYLFDEFDALGADRSGNDVGEARRILNSFLVFLEQSGPESILIASTNHRTLLDRALFRRFDLVITYELPDEQASAAVLKARLGPLGKGIRWTSVQRHTDGLSHAELVKAAEAAAKRSLLAGQDRVSIEVLRDTLADRRQGARA
jgi:SpoVK/Ycf46/Vps4 family AAA+-type ATPase